MAFSFTESIVPMSELRSNPEKVKKNLKKSPIIITNKGRPDFGVCDLETLEIAHKIKNLKDILLKRKKSKSPSVDVKDAFAGLEKKYGF